MDFALKMMNLIQTSRIAYESDTGDEYSIKNDGFCIKNDGFCIQIDEFCVHLKMTDFGADTRYQHAVGLLPAPPLRIPHYLAALLPLFTKSRCIMGDFG